MRLYSTSTRTDETIEQAIALRGTYDRPVTFHSYWNGPLSDKHLLSVKSCYYFNVLNKTANRIVLWVEQVSDDPIAREISRFADIRQFNVLSEEAGTMWEGLFEKSGGSSYRERSSFYSDYVRYLLLQKYTGVWFDLDVLFLRSWDPLFCHFGRDVFVYTWELQNYPNGAIFANLDRENAALENAALYIANRGKGWGFQEAGLTFDAPLDFLVLPCSWFDPGWLPDAPGVHLFDAAPTKYSFENFFPGAFAYHWHNQWNKKIEPDSALWQLGETISASIG